MSRLPVQNIKINKYNKEEILVKEDLLVVEEPLEIRIYFGSKENRNSKTLAVTMRTPGNDFELAYGFLFSEGIITSKEAVTQIRYCKEPQSKEEIDNIIIVHLEENIEVDLKSVERNFYTTSSCGICGKTSIESVCAKTKKATNEQIINSSFINSINNELQQHQILFKHTGGIHAAALFNFNEAFIHLNEDIGRHNAVDKLVGTAIIKEINTENCILWVSGRAGFELVQKAAMTRIPIMISVGAPSTLSVNLAKENNMTLIGFSKSGKFNIYSHPYRVK